MPEPKVEYQQQAEEMKEELPPQTFVTEEVKKDSVI
jgi:hypothetical protein